jgi:hypothetical protein
MPERISVLPESVAVRLLDEVHRLHLFRFFGGLSINKWGLVLVVAVSVNAFYLFLEVEVIELAEFHSGSLAFPLQCSLTAVLGIVGVGAEIPVLLRHHPGFPSVG